MTTHYLIHSPNTGRTLKASYRSGKFFRLEKTAGKALEQADMNAMMVVVPALENQIEEFKAQFKKLEYTKEQKTQSYHQQYVTVWFAFYQKFMDMPPRFNAADGKHITQIKKYLPRISDQDMEGLELFRLILDNWHKLDDFHKDNTDLKYINSRLNPILNAIKKAGKTGTGGADNSVRL